MTSTPPPQPPVQLAQTVADAERRTRLYETFLNNTPDLAYVFDLQHRFIYANSVLLQLWGKTWEEAIGKTCLELGYEPWHADMHSREIDQVVATKQPIRGEVPFAGTFGQRIYDYIFVPVLGPDGEVEAVAGTTRDTTERKQAEQALQLASQRKDEFLAMLAHELRNPLAPISAAAQLIAMHNADQERLQRSIEIINRQVTHMVGLVDDLLDVSRVTRGLVSIDQLPQDLKTVINDSIEQVRPLMESKQHRFSLNLCAEHVSILGDHKRLVQIVTNLLNNAAKYTQTKGSIELDMRVQDGQAVISVSDDGIGIAADDQPHIFELFAQAKRNSDRSQGGLGIGLAVVKGMIELHGGSIHCYSNGIGQGSRFTVYLPSILSQASAAEADNVARTSAQSNQTTVLVVDDNIDAADMLACLLETLGYIPIVENGSLSALQRAQQTRPQVCILDIGLPEMDGNELARRLRAQPETAKALLIAVTGYGQAHDRETSLQAGFDHHLVKPVNLDALIAILAAKFSPH
ncbi:response regulator [Methylobacillus gramineus]|uniref:hybrid sensor histidine kinase/response regulator n=1 Tax=Methylobacillus gramineus TaxID=755169 RepID=UPI001CFF92F3|nr:ATP-binding protein [Methylobacillus gramineus]MCB5185896.1 response regulator [Methylobacillus gramineus]